MNFVDALHRVKLDALFPFAGKSVDFALPKALGDSHLLETNPFFLQVRKKVIELGYGFSSENQDSYSTLPIASLNRILKSKVIPYSPNLIGVKDLWDESRTKFTYAEIPELKTNYTLHEGAHILAYQEAKFSRLDYLEEANIKNIRAMLVQESFSNASEQQGNAFLESAEDYVAYFFNSWIHAAPKEIQKQQEALEIFGSRLTFRSIFLGFIFSNFLYQGLKLKEQQWALAFLLQERRASEKEKKHILFLLNLGFKLSENFRVQTSTFQLQFLGCKKSIFDICKPGVPALFEDTKTGLRDLFERLTAVYYK